VEKVKVLFNLKNWIPACAGMTIEEKEEGLIK
jgi:hypothetical protein